MVDSAYGEELQYRKQWLLSLILRRNSLLKLTMTFTLNILHIYYVLCYD